MSNKQNSVSLPMASAGIIGFSSDMKINGTDLDPKLLVGIALAFVIIVKAADVLVL